MKYFPFGECRNSQGNVATDRLFTGQRLDSTGLYYYGARYYDPQIGRFISADSIVPDPFNPQSLNRYSYCLNNPLKYTDPSGHDAGDCDPAREWYEIMYGFLEVLVDTLTSAFPPYALYESCLPLYEVTTGQKSVSDITPTPSQIWENTVAYYDPSTSRGQGHIFGTAAVAVGSIVAGGIGGRSAVPSAGLGPTEAAVSTERSLIPYFPPNRGAVGGWSETTLQPGTQISRFGTESGRFASPKGTPTEMRSLPPNAMGTNENIYTVTEGLNVEQSTIMPWYNQQGFGIQYYLPDTIENLVNSGFLARGVK